MKKLITYIGNLIEYYKFYQDISQPNISFDVEKSINSFIHANYIKMKKQNYVTVNFDREYEDLKVYIHPEFNLELEIHYPEKLI